MYEKEISKFINELQTRKEYIDPELENRFWFNKYIKQEVNSVKSGFVNKLMYIKK